MRQPFREPALPALAAGCGAAVILLPAASPLRLIAAAALVLVLPGAALARALLTLARTLLPRDERVPEYMLATVGTTAVVVVLAALGLDTVGIPLEPTVWAIALVLITVVGSAVGSLRGFRLMRAGLGLEAPRPRDVLLIGASLALIAGALVLGTKPLNAPRGTPGSTAVWVEADGARGAVAVARSGKLRTARYRLSVTVDGHPVATTPNFTLAPDEQYRLPVRLPRHPGSRVQARLYRLDGEAPGHPRRAELTIGGSGIVASATAGP